jgi:predicted ATPase
MSTIKKITIQGFRSIESATVEFRPLNVFIGANGAGKSNLIALLQLLNYVLSRGLQNYVQTRGPASKLLHFGPKTTPLLRGVVEFESENAKNEYRFSLSHAQGDTLIFTHEEAEYHAFDFPQPKVIPLGGGGHRESGLAEPWAETDATAKVMKALLSKCRVYQFHDTSLESHLRNNPLASDNSYLRADGGNLAAFLFRLREEYPHSYREIERTINVALPWFEDFTLEPQGQTGKQYVPLRWRMADKPDFEFDAGQLSDGSLRIMCLVTLLLQPEVLRPRLIVLDEPELGLHPAAEAMVAGLVKSASRTGQVLISTQSATLLDHFTPEDIVVVENDNGTSTFTRQEPEKLRSWLERYTLGQLYLKNLMGGRP